MRAGGRVDGVSVLTAFLILTFALPSQLVLPGLGGIGAPAVVVALGCLAWWMWDRLHRSHKQTSSPLVAAALLFAAAITASYAAAAARAISPEEYSVASLGVAGAAGWFGVLLVAHDASSDPERMQVLLDRLVLGGVLLAALGLIQFATGRAWVDLISIPGLHEIHNLAVAQVREGFTRPAGTAVHPIEYGAVLCMLMPLAFARGMAGLVKARRGELWFTRGVRRWGPVVLMTIAIVLSGSRSALLGLLVGVVLLLPTWTAVQRLGAVVGGLAVGLGVFLLVPGMTGSVVGLFTGISDDPGVASRVDSYAIAWDYIQRAPFVGRGPATFLPRYRIFDNQYLLSLVEIGVLGLAALISVVVVAMWCASVARRRTTDHVTREIAGATRAAAGVGAVSLALFDGFSFPMMPAIWFLILGMCGATYRLAGGQTASRVTSIAHADTGSSTAPDATPASQR